MRPMTHPDTQRVLKSVFNWTGDDATSAYATGVFDNITVGYAVMALQSIGADADTVTQTARTLYAYLHNAPPDAALVALEGLRDALEDIITGGFDASGNA